jgi:hypothetical protein
MQSFVQRFAGLILGILSGWDRLRFRGTKRWLANPKGLFGFLYSRRVLLQDCGAYAQDTSRQIRTATEELARQHGRPLRYLPSAKPATAEVVHDLLRRQPTRQGLVAILSCVEPCPSFEGQRCRTTQHLHLRRAWRRCLHSSCGQLRRLRRRGGQRLQGASRGGASEAPRQRHRGDEVRQAGVGAALGACPRTDPEGGADAPLARIAHRFGLSAVSRYWAWTLRKQ